MTPRVSVIIPTYNRAHLIGASIESALAQYCPEMEIIVIDDASTDDTEQVVSQIGPAVRYIRQDENRGPAVARNTGIAAARGELIALLDSDDLWLPGKLARQLPLFDDPAIGMVHGRFRWFRDAEPEKLYDGDFAGEHAGMHQFLAFRGLCTQTVVFRKSLFDLAGAYDSAAEPAEDHEFVLRAAHHCEIRGIDEVMAHIRTHGSQISGVHERLYTACRYILRKHRGHGTECAACREALAAGRQKITATYYRDLNAKARSAIRSGRVLTGLRLGALALWTQPQAILRAFRVG